MKPTEEPIWTVRANVVDRRPYGPLGIERRFGTKHFRPGAKVFIIDAYFGMTDAVVVIGRHRATARYVKMVLDVTNLSSFRPDLVYSPSVISMACEHFGRGHAPIPRERAAELAQLFRAWREARAESPARTLFEVIPSPSPDLVRLRNLAAPPDSCAAELPARLIPAALRAPHTRIEYTRSDTGEVTLRETDDSPFSGESG